MKKNDIVLNFYVVEEQINSLHYLDDLLEEDNLFYISSSSRTYNSDYLQNNFLFAEIKSIIECEELYLVKEIDGLRSKLPKIIELVQRLSNLPELYVDCSTYDGVYNIKYTKYDMSDIKRLIKEINDF